MENFKSPVARLARLFQKSRDAWKANALDKQRRLRAAQIKIRDLDASRAYWKDRALAAERGDQPPEAEGISGAEDDQPEGPAQRLVLSAPPGHHHSLLVMQLTMHLYLSAGLGSRGGPRIRANIAGKPLKFSGEARSVGHFAAMLRAPQPVDLAFEAFLKELPPEYATMAREFKAFARPRKLKTPAQLLQVVMLYCGLDQALRTTAGSFTLLEERITETAIHQRLRACGPWLKALLHRLLPATATPLSTLRLLIVDGSSLQGPGAEGTDDRVHLALDLTQMTVHAVDVTGVDGGETLTRDPWQAGDIVLVDRGYHQPRVILDLFARGVGVIVRLNPTAMPLFVRRGDADVLDPAAVRLEVAAHRRAHSSDTLSLPVWLRAPEVSGPGWLHAVRLPPEAAEAARRRCRKTAQRKGRTPSDAT